MRPDLAPEPGGDRRDVPLNDEVELRWRALQQQVTDGAADEVHRRTVRVQPLEQRGRPRQRADPGEQSVGRWDLHPGIFARRKAVGRKSTVGPRA